MLDLLYYGGMFFITIFILVGVHEWGHYRTAIFFGIPVDEFYIGFGPILFSRITRRGERIGIRAIPLGGYVKFSEDKDMPFNERPLIHRVFVAMAGPVANLSLALILLITLGVTGREVTPPIIGSVDHSGLTISRLMTPGARITAIDGDAIRSWGQISQEFASHAGEFVSVTFITSDGWEKQVNVQVPEPKDNLSPLLVNYTESVFKIHPRRLITVIAIKKNSPASLSSLELGDIIVSIDKQSVKGHAVVSFLRKNKPYAITIPLDNHDNIGITMQGKNTAHERIRYGVIESIQNGFSDTVRMTVLVAHSVYDLMSGSIPVKYINGPVTIADMAGQTAMIGIGTFVYFLAIISINLGVLNLIPMPLLDGGLLLFYAIEAVRGSPVKDRQIEILSYCGMFAIGMLTILALFNDYTVYAH